VIRTYARQKRPLYDAEPPAKRRRVECAVQTTEDKTPSTLPLEVPAIDSEPPLEIAEPPTSSSNNSPAPWSDDVPRSSPPSSPITTSSPPPVQKRRPVFSLFKKQVRATPSTKQPALSERSHNAQSPTRPPHTKTKRMVQMQLDLASESRKACKICGMEYIPSNAEDAALHRKFHAMNVGGVDFTKATVERLRKAQIWSGGDGSFIAVIGRKDALALRNRTSDVLKVVNTELGAVPISDEELWSQTSPCAGDGQLHDSTHSNDQPSTAAVDRYKTYLYVRSQKCIGACLAERIWEAYTVLAQDDASAQTRQLFPETKSSSISVSTTTTTALMGISRIWASNSHRKQGVATSLLDCARSDFLYGLTVEKGKVAFSQPTESGGNLARRWFGCEDGWHVYMD
jgi:hypothetical protein